MIYMVVTAVSSEIHIKHTSTLTRRTECRISERSKRRYTPKPLGFRGLSYAMLCYVTLRTYSLYSHIFSFL